MGYSQYVHEFEAADGSTRYAVAQYIPSNGQYIRPLDKTEARLTGCSAEYAGTPAGVQSYPTRRQALRRARYLFGQL